MTDKLGPIIRKYWLVILTVLAAAAYNNWLLAPWLNRNLFGHNGSVSEYSVASQPYHWLFQSLDIVSGILFIIIGLAMWQGLKNHLSGRILALGTAVLGLANMLDAAFRLPCSQTLNPACRIPVVVSNSRIEIPSHAYSSLIIGICYLLLPLAALAYAARYRLRQAVIFSLLLIGNSLVSLTSAVYGYVQAGALTTKTSGSGQEFQMLLLGIWMIICFTAFRTSNNQILKSRRQQEQNN